MTSVQPLWRSAATTGGARLRDVLQQPCQTAPATQPEGLRWWVSVLALVLLGVVSAQAQVTYFRVGGGGNWNSMANWSLASGGAGGAGVPGPGDIVVFDAASGSPAITLNGNFTVGQVNVLANANVTFSAAVAQTLTITGIAASATPPLFIASLGRMRVADFATVDIGAGGTSALNGASISGTITISINGTVTNSSTKPFFVESGGTLEMAGGTYTNIAGTIAYATTGACGTLMYSRPDNTTVTIPLPNAVNEVTNTPGALGNLSIRRNSFSAQTTLANPGGNYFFAGQLTVDNCIFTLGDQAILPASTLEFSSSRMLNGGKIQGNRNAQLTFTDPSGLNPTTAELDFVATPGLFTLTNDGQGLVGLRNNVRTLNINLLSDLNIYGNTVGGNGLQITSPVPPFAGQITIGTTRTLSMRNGATGLIQGDNNGRLVVNGTLHISTNASITNNNATTIASPLSGIVVNPNGRIRIWGGDANGGTPCGIISAGNVGRTFYVDATARLEYLDQGDGTTTLNAGGFPITQAGFSQTPKLATRAEIPELMLGSITINRSSSATMGVGNLREAVLVNMPNQLLAPNVASTTLQGGLTITQGMLGLNNTQVIINGNVSTTVGGSIAGTDAAGTSALVYRSSNAGQLRVTSATVAMTFGQHFNYIEVAGSGNLTLNGAYTIDGSTAVAQYGQAGVSNYNGQLRFTGSGNLIMGSSEITFNGAAAANLTPAAQGGHIPSTTGTSGALFGDTGARLNFFSRAARSFLRFAAGGQQLGFLTVGNPTMAMIAVDYIASLRTPLTINGILTLQQNAVLQLGPGGNLSYQNANISFANPTGPTQTGNFIDASQGGTLNITNVAVGSFAVPVGVGFTETPVYANGFTPTLRRLTIQNPTAGENYTVTVTSAIVNAVPGLPTLAARSMRGQWNVTKGNPAFTGNITTEWFPEPYNPVTGFGSEPVGANEFQPRMTANQSLTSMRRFSSGSYVNVLPVVTPLPPAMGAVTAMMPAPRLITATHTGTLSNTIFIISNELFPTYWVGGASDNWGLANNWASTSGGAPGSASVPGINDFPVFDRNVTTTIRQNIPSLTRVAPATALQKLSIIDGANVTLAPTDIPTTLELIQDADDDNLFVAQNARLTIGAPGASNITVRIPQTTGTMPMVTLATGPDAAIFGTLALQNGGTFDMTNMTGSILIANGGTLQMAGGTFQKNAATVLQYGQNTNSVRPYGNTGEQNATLSYSDNNGGIITPPIGPANELPATPLPGKLFINKTSPGAGVKFSMAYAITSSATVQAGILDISGVTFQVGTGTAPVTSVAAAAAGVNRALVVNPSGLIRGTNTTVLGLNGLGAGTLRFEPGTTINTLSLNDFSAAAPNGGVNTTLLTDLVANDVQIVNGTRAVGTPSYSVPHALTIDNNRTLRIMNAASAIASGRVLARGTLFLDGAAPANLALPAVFSDGGLDVATTGTLTISNAAVVNGTPTANPVRYLDRTALLSYVNQGVGGSRTVNQTEMPNVFAGSMTVNKLSTMPANNVVSLDVCKAVTQGTLSIVNGFLDLNNFALKVGGVINPATAGLVGPPYHHAYTYADVLNSTVNTSAMNMTGGFIVPYLMMPLVPNQAAIIYNSNSSSNLFLRQQVAAATNVPDPVNTNMYPAVFLNKLEINSTARLTLATTSAVTIDNTAGLTACEPLNAGQLRLVDNTGELALNGSRLAFTGAGAAGGRLMTASTAGSIIGDALPSTSLRFLSSPPILPAPYPAMQVLRVGSGTGAQFHSIEVDVPAGAPNAQTYLRMTNPVTTVALGVTRGIISLTSSTVTLNVTGGVNSTSGNQTANEAAFAQLNPVNRNNNFIDCSGGGRLGLVIGTNQRRMFPVGAINNTLTALRIAPVTIFNPGAADTYFVGADSGITHQPAVYPNRVNVEWSISKNSGTATNNEVQLGWHTEHETALVRTNSFPAQWTGSAYNPFTNTINDATFPGTVGNPGTAGYPPVQDWSQTIAPLSGTLASANPWVVIAPPIAVFVAADSLNFNGSGGFNPTNPNGFSTGQLTITSGTAFTIRASAFNGLNQRSAVVPAALPKNLFYNLHPLPGGTAIFSTSGTGSTGFPVQLNVPNPVSGTSTNITFNWVNARPTQMSTQAQLHIWDPTIGPNSLRAVPLTITINAPTASPNAIAFTNSAFIDATRATSTTTGFSNNAVQLAPLDANGQPTFNVTGGVGIPINFGLYRIAPVDDNQSQTGFIQNTSATMVDDRDFMITISNPPGGTAIFSTTGVAPSVTRATINIGQGTGTLFPIFNWIGYDHDSPIYGGPNTGVPLPGLAPGGGQKQPVGTTTAVITLTLRRYVPNPARDGGGTVVQILSTSVTVQISSGATQAVTLAYSAVSQDITGLPNMMGIAPLEQRRLRPDGFGANYDASTVSIKPLPSDLRFPLLIGAFGANGAVLGPVSPAVVQLQIAPFPTGSFNAFAVDFNTDTLTAANPVRLMQPRVRWVNPPPSGGSAQAVLTLTHINGGFLQSTQVTITVTSSANLGIQAAFTQRGFPRTFNQGADGLTGLAVSTRAASTVTDPVAAIESGGNFNINFAIYNTSLSSANPFTSTVASIANPMALTPEIQGFGTGVQMLGVYRVGFIPDNATDIIDVDPTSGFQTTVLSSINPLASFSNVRLNWRNAPLGAGPFVTTGRLVIGHAQSPFVSSTTISVQIVSSATIPVTLAYSRISSTASETLPQFPVVSGTPINIDLSLFSARGALANSLANVPVTLSVPSGFSITGNINGVFVNQSTITFNGVRVFWTGAPAAGGTTRVPITATPAPGSGIGATTASFTITAGNTAPQIVNFSPSAATNPGFTDVTISGANLNGANSVVIGNVMVQILSTSPGAVVVRVPQGTSGFLTVCRPADPNGAFPAGCSNQLFFGMQSGSGTCNISDFQPRVGGAGTEVRITGRGFTGVTAVSLAGVGATIVSVNDTVLVVRLGTALMNANGGATVQTPSCGLISSPSGINFSYSASPVITSVTPSTIQVSGRPVEIIIRGQNFSTTGMMGVGREGVFFGVANDLFQDPIQVQSRTSTEIRATIPATSNNRAGVRTLTVRNVDGQTASITITLTPAPAPTLLSVTPNTTTATGSAFQVVVRGRGFFGELGMNVTLNGVSTPFRAVGDSLVIFDVPVSLNIRAGTISAVVANNDGQAVTAQIRVNDAPAPTITSVTPPNVPFGAPSARIVVNGTGFFPAAIFQIGTIVVPPVFVTPTQAVLDVPESVLRELGQVTLRVINTDGKQAFTVLRVLLPPPTITGFTPASGTTSATQSPLALNINGTNFRGAFNVTFVRAGTTTPLPLVVVATSATQIQLRVAPIVPRTLTDPSLAGDFVITVTNPDFQATSANYRVLPYSGPIINSVTPSSTAANGTAFVARLDGINLANPQSVTFLPPGGITPVPLQILSQDRNGVSVLIPPGLNTTIGRARFSIVLQDGQRFDFDYTTSVRVFTPIAGALFPNPVSDVLTVEAEMPRPTTVRVRLSDVLGRTVVETREQVSAGIFRTQLNVSQLPAGVYIFELLDGDRRLLEKVIKQ